MHGKPPWKNAGGLFMMGKHGLPKSVRDYCLSRNKSISSGRNKNRIDVNEADKIYLKQKIEVNKGLVTSCPIYDKVIPFSSSYQSVSPFNLEVPTMFQKIIVFLMLGFWFLLSGQAWCQTSFAILPMEVRGDVKSEKVEGAISNLYQVLVNSKKYRIVDRDHVKTVLGEQSFQISGVTDKKDAVKLGKLLNVEKLIATSIYMKSEKQLAINLRVIDVATGQAEFYKEISYLNYTPADHGRYCASEIMVQYPLLGSIEGVIKDIVIVNIGENQGLKSGDRLFVARKEVLRGNDGEILFQEYKRIGTLEILNVDSKRSKTRLKELLNSNELFAKADLVSPEPIPKKKQLSRQLLYWVTWKKGN